MANPEHLNLLNHDPKDWNAWRWKNWNINPDLSNLDLSGREFPSEMNFREVDFSGSNLSSVHLPLADFNNAKLVGANLSKLDATGAKFSSCNASDSNCTSAILHNADFSSADLSRARFVNAGMSDATLWSANLSNADLTGAYLRGADFMDANLSCAKLIRTDLMLSRFLRTNLCGATLEECYVHGISAWRVQVDAETSQTELIISDPSDPPLRIDDLEIAQFIYLLVNHSKLRNAIDSVTKKGVLILGRFNDGGLAALQAIAAELRSSGYLPFIFDFERPKDRNITETVKTLVGISRFVVVDLSGRSVPHELYATVPHFKIPFVPILEKGRKKYAMVDDILEFPWVVNPIYRFKSIDQLRDSVTKEIVAPAEKILESRRSSLNAKAK